MSKSHIPHSTLRHGLFLLILCCLSWALYLFRLNVQSIWWDEGISIHLARSGLAEIVADRAGNLHPPLYFFLLKTWVAVAGDSPFSVRFLSAWPSTLLIPGIYAFGRRWLDDRTGLIAATLAALSPLYLAYAQEARVYAMLPLVYLVLLALARRLSLPTRPPGWLWLLLAGAEIFALGLHYMSLFAVAYVLATLIVRFHRRRADLARLLAVQCLVGLSFIPWLLAILARAGVLSSRLSLGNWQDTPVTLAHYLRLLWTFQLTGLTALVADPSATVLTTAVAITVTGAMAYLLLASPALRRPTAVLLLDWLVPLASAFVVWWIRPLSHPRYGILFTPALLLLLAHVLNRLLERSHLGKIVMALLATLLAATSTLGLVLHFAPRFAKDDTQGAVAAIAARSTTGDLVLIPPEDWSIPYYYAGPGRVEMVWPGDTPADWERLAALTEDTRTVFLVGYYRATRDPRALLPFALESSGNLNERWEFKGLYVRMYRLRHPVAPPQPVPTHTDFGPLRLTAAWIEPTPAADTALTLALSWRKEEVAGERYRVSLRLRDLDGWELAANDDWLLDLRALPTDRWNVGGEATTYHVLPLAPGTPPLTYTVSIGVYASDSQGTLHRLDLLDAAGNPQGQSYEVGVVALAPARGPTTDPYGVAPDLPLLPEPASLADGLLLEAAALDRAALAPGQSVFVTLRWRALEAPLPDLRPALALSQADSILATVESAPAGGRYPTGRWQAGEVVLEHRRLTVPPTAADGPATVTIRLGNRQAVLGQVTIAAGEHTFAPPPMAHEIHVRFGDVAELLGYDLATGPYTADQTVPITLYWQALEGAASADRTVFTHLLAADGHLVGQHDGPPVAGSRPTTGWLAGEIIADRHEMAFREPYAGLVHVEVGWYDPTTLERVPTENGASFVLLPTALTIQAP